MGRTTIDTLKRALALAYEADRAHSLQANLRSITPDEWRIQPADPHTGDDSTFGNDPVLSVCDIVKHVGSAKYRYAHLSFGDLSQSWEGHVPDGEDMENVIAWLDSGQRTFLAGLDRIQDDSMLSVERSLPSGLRPTVERLIFVVINHDLYHAGEINRQVSLIRGADGWERRPG